MTCAARHSLARLTAIMILLNQAVSDLSGVRCDIWQERGTVTIVSASRYWLCAVVSVEVQILWQSSSVLVNSYTGTFTKQVREFSPKAICVRIFEVGISRTGSCLDTTSDKSCARHIINITCPWGILTYLPLQERYQRWENIRTFKGVFSATSNSLK